MTNEEKLKILIEAHNKAQKAFDEVNAQVDRTEKRFGGMADRLDKVGSKMKDVGGKMTVGVTLPILAGAGMAVKAFSDLNETINKIDVSFGASANTVKAWSENSITSMGLAQQSALDAAALFGDMGTGMGQNQEEASKMSMALTQLGADMASFKNVSFDRAQTALAGIYTGETEALKSLGVVMTEANLEQFAMEKGIKKQIKDMTQAEKVQLRYNYVMEKTKNAQGDFARTSDGLANQTRMSGERVKQLAADFGEKLAPAYAKVLEVGNKLLDWFNGLSGSQQTAVIAIAGFIAALGPAIMVIGHLITAIKGIGIALTFLGAHPIILIIMAVIAVIAGLAFLIIKNWDTLKQWFNTFWNWLMGIVSTVIAFIKANWDKLLPIILGPLGLLIAIIIKNWDTIKAGFAAAVNFIASAARSVWSTLTGIFNGVRNTITTVFVSAANTVSSVWNGIKNFFSGLGGSIKNGIANVGGFITAPFSSAFNSIKNLWNSTVGRLSFQAPDWVPGIGGKGWSMPKLYTGVRNFTGGPAIVGDVMGRGGEIVSLPRGTDVFSNRESRNILRSLADGNGGGGKTQTVNIGTIVLDSAEAVKEMFNQLDADNLLVGRGLTANRGGF